MKDKMTSKVINGLTKQEAISNAMSELNKIVKPIFDECEKICDEEINKRNKRISPLMEEYEKALNKINEDYTDGY